MKKFKMQFVHPSTESEFIDWLNGPVKDSGNTDPVLKAAIEQIQNAEINPKSHFVKKSDLLIESKDVSLNAKVDTKSIRIEVSEDGETCYMSSGCLDRISKIIDRILPCNQRLWKRKMKRVNKLNR